MICLMHEAEPYGSLLVNGAPVSEKQLASLVGATVREVRAAMAELQTAGVFSEADGVIFSRRMKRDFEKAQRDRANGRGGGNPRLKQGVNPEDKAQIPDTREPEKKDAPKQAPLFAPDPPTDEAEYFTRGKKVLGPDAGGLLVRLLTSKKKNVALARAAIEQASTKSDPREYIGRIISGPAAANERHGINDPLAGIQ